MIKPTLKLSPTALALADRIVRLLESGARPLNFFRSYAPTQAIFEQGVGILFIRGQVKFAGHGKGRRLARAGR